ncbi:MAG: hypothetical protein ATN31_09310 [Candidatus Epulonipiscioides saccharophilum]|nr:MAG: hypothetical protein ATN31_09310 [Epulopiscium sp. AS2M-Bin001]
MLEDQKHHKVKDEKYESKKVNTKSQKFKKVMSYLLTLGLGGVIGGGIYWTIDGIKSSESIEEWVLNLSKDVKKIIGIDSIMDIEEPPEQSNIEIVRTYTMPFLECNAVKILALTLFNELAPEKYGDNWYDIYYRTLEQDPRFDFFTIENSSKIMTHGQTALLIENILGDKFNLVITEDAEKLNISLIEFYNAYQMVLDKIGRSYELSIERIDILKTTGKENGLQAWTTQTSKGIYGYHGLILEPLIGSNLEVIVKGKDIVGILEIRKGVIEDERQFEDRVLKITGDYIEFEQSGKVFLDEDTSIDLGNLCSGAKVSCVTKNNRLEKLAVINSFPLKNIRVVISKDGQQEYYHDKVQITAKSNTQVTYNNQIIDYLPNQVIDLDALNLYVGEKVVLGKLYNDTYKIHSITRKGINPTYVGSIEIYKEEEGYVIVNEVDLENYVARVINSEMPSYFGVEACKVQAICARSYAIREGSDSEFLGYGANVDDTAKSQVYNNIEVNEIAKEATRQTKDQVLIYENSIVSANFYSTSSGNTANFGEVWAQEIFPTQTPEYLASTIQYWDAGKIYNMKDEEDAYEFFNLSKDEISAFDDHAVWFRWTAKFVAEELSKTINNALKNLSESQKKHVKFINEEKEEHKLVYDIGDVWDMCDTFITEKVIQDLIAII